MEVWKVKTVGREKARKSELGEAKDGSKFRGRLLSFGISNKFFKIFLNHWFLVMKANL